MSAGATAAAGPAARRGRRAGFPRLRDPHVDHCVGRKLTRSERLLLLHLDDHLRRLDRRLQRCAQRHGEPI